jgi:hypothetical protein
MQDRSPLKLYLMAEVAKSFPKLRLRLQSRVAAGTGFKVKHNNLVFSTRKPAQKTGVILMQVPH